MEAVVVNEKKYLSEEIEMEKAIEELEEHDRIVKKLEEDSKKYRVYEMTLNMPETKFDELGDLRVALNARLDMWRGLRDWRELTNKWMGMKFEEINV